jgi:TldD protein
MNDLVRTQPERFFADRFNVTPGLMERLLGGSLVGRVDDADIYLEYRVNEELVLEENVVKKASRHVSQGAGVRAQADTRTGYAHTDEISLGNLEEAARQARAIAPGPRARSPWPAAGGRTISTRWSSHRS